MDARECAEARERVALGDEAGAVEHLRGCAECRREAEALRRVVTALVGVQLSVAPPSALDAAVRRRLALECPPRPLLRPTPAMALALAGVTALCVALSIAFEEAGHGALSVPFAVGVTVLYLALCTAAMVPLLVHRAGVFGRVLREVHR